MTSGDVRCDDCGTTERPVEHSEDLGATLCGSCFAERADRAELAGVLHETQRFLGRFCRLPGEAEETVLPLYVAHTHALDGAHATPYLLITSPERRSGKTRVQEALELLVARPWRVTGASEAAIFRKIAQDRPTLLLDEVDAIFGSHSERTEPLRAILNAGNRPGVAVARCVGEKGDQVRDFPVFCPKVLGGIDRGNQFPDTIVDRSIRIAMRRKTRSEPVERFRHRFAAADAEPLRDKLAQWGEGAAARLIEAEPAMPPELDDRAAEGWEPLQAIADLAGGEWPQLARRAALELSASEDEEGQSLGALLLVAVRSVFDARDRLTTADLLESINRDEELPFGGWRDGRGLDSRGLARMLKPYAIKPRTIRIGENANQRGYRREQFVDAWERWVPPPVRTQPPQAPQAPQATLTPTPAPHEQAVVADVADVAAGSNGVAYVAGNGRPERPEWLEDPDLPDDEREGLERAQGLVDLGVAAWDEGGIEP